MSEYVLPIGHINNDVLGGAEGCLFLYNGGHKEMDHLMGSLSPDNESLIKFNNNIRERSKFCLERNIKYCHIIYPSKSIVMKRFLPNQYASKVQSLYERCFLPSLKEEGLDKFVMYPVKKLQENDRPYRFHDTHLSFDGCRTVIVDICDQLSLPLPRIESMAQDTKPITGDLAIMLKSPILVPERISKPLNLNLFHHDNSPFLPGNTHNISVLHNPLSQTPKRLLIFGDSFIKLSLTQLSDVFRDILYVRSATFQRDIVEMMSPDIILTSNAERYMAQISSDLTSKSLLMAYHGLNGYAPKEKFTNALEAQLSFSHHPSVYSNWVTGWSRNFTKLSREHEGAMTANIKVIDNAKGYYESLGDDPQIRFILDRESAIRGCEIIINIDVEADNRCTLFLSDPSNISANFSAERALSQDLKPGSNLVKFRISPGTTRQDVRVDPIIARGSFKLTGFMVMPFVKTGV